jgi:hypothetical protein
MKKTSSLFLFAAILFASAQASAACAVADERVCAINTQLQAYAPVKVDYVEQAPSVGADTAVEYAWVAPGRQIIRVGDTLKMDDKALAFALTHEYGRAVANHGRKLVEHVTMDYDLQLSDAALLEKYGFHASACKPSLKVFNHRQVLEADAFAVAAIAKLGQDPVAAMQAALASRDATAYHPAASTRVARAKERMGT